MRETYKAYFATGYEPLKFFSDMYAEDKGEIVKAAVKIVEHLAGYRDVRCRLVILKNNDTVVDFTF